MDEHAHAAGEDSRGGSVHIARTVPLSIGKRGGAGEEVGRGWRAKIPFHVAQKGTVFSPGEPGEEAESPEETEENRLLQLLK
jgi:hypothetical protein